MVLNLLAGLFLIAASFALQIHDVEFNGYVSGEKLAGFPVAATYSKQVGYVWAPNWAITGLLLLPLALVNLLLAIREIERLLRELVSSGMLRRKDFSPADPDLVIAKWRDMARPWALIGLGVAVSSGLYIGLFDFWPVVLEWLWMEPSEHQKRFVDLQDPVGFIHPLHEFDWSVAATFDGALISTTANAIFGFAAYFLIAIVGMGIVFGAFIFLCSFSAFFSETMRHELDLILVPDLGSDDSRCGFERFESFFHHLILAAIFTGTMAVAMHLQNVFLRSTEDETIIDMVFGGAIAIFQKDFTKLSIEDFTTFLRSMNDVVDLSDYTLSLQTYAAPIVLFMIGAITFSCLWLWLRRAAIDGRLIYRNNPSLSDEESDKLDEMDIWPIGWMSLDLLISVGVVVFLSLWFVNFVSLVLLYFAVKALAAILSAVWETVVRAVKRRRKRNDRKRGGS
ncbi:hypothetical protein GFB49_17515 [Epibacterium sp. SM1979]|uniref:Uncharacterized protein n=1 Tax=Tritonibacter litoralis TaxID=2662264 RepID=A0A843YM45_9RHOB|nr:hypothetical protein [Tritonibacter litoralis]MQQ10269.1 hypothetical protein [Tritonibacter litoralis]